MVLKLLDQFLMKTMARLALAFMKTVMKFFLMAYLKAHMKVSKCPKEFSSQLFIAGRERVLNVKNALFGAFSLAFSFGTTVKSAHCGRNRGGVAFTLTGLMTTNVDEIQ